MAGRDWPACADDGVLSAGWHYLFIQKNTIHYRGGCCFFHDRPRPPERSLAVAAGPPPDDGCESNPRTGNSLIADEEPWQFFNSHRPAGWWNVHHTAESQRYLACPRASRQSPRAGIHF